MLDLLHKDSATVSRETAVISRVALARIVDNPYQYRRHYKEESLRELAININSLTWQLPATSGLQQPGMGRVVRRDGAGVDTPIDPATYDNPGALVRLFDDPAIFVQLAYGHRRVRAFHILATGPKQFFPNTRADDWPTTEPTEFGTFPLQLAHLDDQAMAEFALTENSQREDVSAIEEAALLQRMIDELGISLEDVGRKFGWGRSTVSNKLRLLRLPDRVQQLVLAGDISEKHARGLLRIEAAPTILTSLADKCRAEMWPTRKLEDKITESIRMLHAVPDQKTTVPGQYGDTTVSPPWDMAWQPQGEGIRGACIGCPARITFGSERAPRCIDVVCYDAKRKAWPMEDFARQRAAARPVLDQLHGGDTLVDVMTDGGKRRVPILEQPIKDTWKLKDSLHLFAPGNLEEAVIIDNGICGPHCKCFAACFEEPYRYYQDTGGYRSARWRPAPNVAPDVVYCCTDPACLAGHLKGAKGEAEQRRQAEQEKRNAELATDPAWAARQKQREEEDARQEQQKRERKAKAQQLVDGAVAATGGVNELWTNKAFLVDLFALCENEYYKRPQRQDLDTKTVDELHDMIIQRVMMGQFMSGGQYDLTAVQTLANRIAPAKPQPGPGDSQKTDWQSGWDENDEAAYQNLMGVWDGGSWNQMLSLETEQRVTQRTLLRLIESCPRKDARGELWARYNMRKEAA